MLGFVGFGVAGAFESLTGQIVCLCLALMGVYRLVPGLLDPAHRLPDGVCGRRGLALINSVGNLAGYVGPPVVAWLTRGTGDSAPRWRHLTIDAAAAIVALFLRVQRRRGEPGNAHVMRRLWGLRWWMMGLLMVGVDRQLPHAKHAVRRIGATS